MNGQDKTQTIANLTNVMLNKSFRTRLLLLTIFLGALPVLASSLFITFRMEQALISEKQQKLFGITRILDSYLVGTYETILSKHSETGKERDSRIRILNSALSRYTDEIAAAYPGVGVGYYSKDLDAIITYGPSSVYGHTVGLSIAADHRGREVMANGVELVQDGSLVRGNIMNAMHPVIRDNQTIGYIWANELTEDIEAQIGEIKKSVHIATFIGLLLGLLGVALIVDNLSVGIDQIKKGVLHLQNDLEYRVPKLHGELGEIAAAINLLGIELSAKRALEIQVQRTERLAAVGEMAAGLAHEVRNPLMSIRGFAQLLQEENTNCKQQDYLDIIVRETERMNHLIEQLLYYARPVVNRIEPVQINAIVENVMKLMESQLRPKNIRAVFALDPMLPLVRCDAEQLKQVLLNLLINAIQAIDELGTIKISSLYHANNEYVELLIEDSGRGISPEFLERIFDPFFTTKEQGTGLGLSVAFRLMEAWGGSIRVTSAVGAGSVFVLKFPVNPK